MKSRRMHCEQEHNGSIEKSAWLIIYKKAEKRRRVSVIMKINRRKRYVGVREFCIV